MSDPLANCCKELYALQMLIGEKSERIARLEAIVEELYGVVCWLATEQNDESMVSKRLRDLVFELRSEMAEIRERIE